MEASRILHRAYVWTPLYFSKILLLWGGKSRHRNLRGQFFGQRYETKVISQLFKWDKAQKDERLHAQLYAAGGFCFSSLNGDKAVCHFVLWPWFTLWFSWRAVDHDPGSQQLSVEDPSLRTELGMSLIWIHLIIQLSHCVAGRFAWNLCCNLIKNVSQKGKCDQLLIRGMKALKIWHLNIF